MFRFDQLHRQIVAFTGALVVSAVLLSAAAPIVPIA